jgi:mRNA interferase MazF
MESARRLRQVTRKSTPSRKIGFEARRLAVDKITTVPRSKLGRRLGRLNDTDLLRPNRAMLVFLGLARSTRSAP